jgi:hypothetical protein
MSKGSFITSSRFQEISRQSFKRHARTPQISPDAYFRFKGNELQNELEGKKLLYLDTCHWVNLRHVVLNSSSERTGYRQILETLRRLHARRTIRCPISFLLFLELMKQTDPKTLIATAQLMDEFSDGLCFQFPNELARFELRSMLLEQLTDGEGAVRAGCPWTVTGFLCGEMWPEIASLPRDANYSVGKVWIDLMWAVRLEQIVDMIKQSKLATDFWERYAAASNADAMFYRTSQFPYSEVLQREKALLIRKLMKEELPHVGQELWRALPQCRDPSWLRQLPEPEYSPWKLPSFQILAGISAADMLTPMKFEANDMLDYRHAALAIPYCDAVFCDKPMAARLRNKPCEFGKVYDTEILGQPVEISSYLTKLLG